MTENRPPRTQAEIDADIAAARTAKAERLAEVLAFYPTLLDDPDLPTATPEQRDLVRRAARIRSTRPISDATWSEALTIARLLVNNSK